MSRPTYSLAGFARRLLLSRVRLHLIVEGKHHDPAFFGGILEASPSLQGAGAEVVPVELVAPGGGKAAVLALFDYCRQNGHLVVKKRSTETVAAFALDRDSDFVTGGTRRSPHVIYTKNYDVEADILENADLVRTLSAGLSLTPAEARHVASHLPGWTESLARVWNEWIVKCCLAKHFGASCGVTFRRPSSINSPLYGPLNRQEERRHEADLRRASGAQRTEYLRRRSIIESRVNSRIDSGRGAELVRGKWLPAYLDHLIAPHLPSRHLPARRLGAAVTHHALATLDFNKPWSKYYLDQLESL